MLWASLDYQPDRGRHSPQPPNYQFHYVLFFGINWLMAFVKELAIGTQNVIVYVIFLQGWK